MARRPKPWFDEYREAWYVNIRGVRHRLDTDKAKAETRFHELMLEPDEAPLSDDYAIAIIDRYLRHCEKENPDSYDWYYRFLNPFCQVVKELRVDEVKVSHVTEFIDQHTWGPSGKRAAITAIKRAFNWAVKQGIIKANPVKEAEKPEAPIREQVISRDMHKDILKRVPKAFGELIELAWETGARPFELYRLETRHLELKNSRAVYPKTEAKGKKRPRVIYFSAKALKIIKRNMRPSGPVMQNDDGAAWTIYAINCAFSRLQAAMGREIAQDIEISDRLLKAKIEAIRKIRAKKAEVKRDNDEKPMRVLTEAELKRQARTSLEDSAARKNAPKFCLYAYRHSFAHRKLSEGVDSMTVATWLGHKDTQMLARVYGHLHQNQDFLLAQLNK